MGSRHLGLLLLAASGGLLTALAFPLGPPLPIGDHPGWWFVGWVALVPLLVAALDSATALGAAGCGLAGGVAANGIILAWMLPFLHRWGGLSWPAAWAVFLVLVLYLALYHAGFAVLVRIWRARLNEGQAILLAPAAWVGLEFCRGHLFGGFPWCPLGASQQPQVLTTQIADLAGVHGVSFALASGAGLVTIAARWRSVRCPGGAVALLVVVLGTVAYGYGRLGQNRTAADGVDGIEVALIQANVPQSLKWDPLEAERIEREHLAMTRSAARAGARLIVWSESSVPRSLTADPDYAAMLGDLADETGAEIVLGSVAYDLEGGERVPYNSAFLVRPGRGVAGRYDKQRLVPFGEYVPLSRLFWFLESLVSEAGDFRPGNRPALLRAEDVRLGPLICYEAIFPSIARHSVGEGVQILVNITNDAWYAGTAMPRQHLALAALRAVEERRPLIRCANTGISAFVDPEGRITSRTQLDEAAVLTQRVVPRSVVSLYAALGDVFALGCVILTLLAAGHAMARAPVRAKRGRQADAGLPGRHETQGIRGNP